MPESVGDTRTQSLAGSSGSATSPRCSIESALVATSGLPPDAFTIAYEGMLLWYWRASTDLPTRRFAPTSPRGGEVKPRTDLPTRRVRATLPTSGEACFGSPSDRLPVLRRARVGHGQPPVARRHSPPFHAPAALT